MLRYGVWALFFKVIFELLYVVLGSFRYFKLFRLL